LEVSIRPHWPWPTDAPIATDRSLTAHPQNCTLHISKFSVDGKERHKIEKGSPQGSSLLLLLFIIFFGTLLNRLRDIINPERSSECSLTTLLCRQMVYTS
jgi:hypothetical protein